ncbi:tRNA (adenosine(37)-N6)-threonylcarbamoyltransferase complex dimerization subunit type 1 TsaB [Candidatus Daviesbacteria bacterium RIFCSPHIGHO2_02_FULL_41_14]|uniref:tRNA (Adenosine(37)-N6)-threonylcarbamoyltransferase complex dimerization subunit type 1 TsaB n=1 Tax=Candidatus Daviesbacteria bacterium RIFCSPLOWO2_01_FULL_40_24 TaxID=1797787 RepID=A0A1F5MK76_9BACT|nr:MAG: tRNA (adenosine(37)-N6)-threonylcarbamoyltransferase complex dimerization subunit type 1 TsaB [Candidatus Daviesbacteria bacterium RIFCSPHIGHO2_01_FULL_41_45]OGE35138.1 MAG: tRNA (adenosine(37)-N6)-threonylcarbamoyltransferase complex dimerization subunit type 1 TsaB [Candidatus Daviesbacteria bacterium RIFCSPHIGHO2_02_FULL_41_14]OGE65786.1 MAG: tRNA (adenosine(37)-N6)-threonylcarbamoyltransferase complex dimerization subunit type 1 TsaB [Candidatus Daviesbacteria bacterium RIFCSPLOWO2_01
MILHIDSSDQKKVIVSLTKEGEVVRTLEGEHQYGSQILLPLIMEILASQGVSWEALTAVKVEEGPGSYTGLRVGAAVAQSLGYTLNIPVNNQVNQPVRLKYS